MTKQEFLDVLRQALNGRMASQQLAENMRFYEDYINMEVRKGKSEEEVLAALGDPRLIARTIVETNGGQSRQSAESYGGSRPYGSRGEQEYGANSQSEGMPRKILVRIPPWVWLILLIIVVVLVLSAVFSVLAAVLPVLLPILLVLFLVKVFRDWLN